MNHHRLIAAISLALGASTAFTHGAFAAEGNTDQKTRAQVYAELEQARADGSFYSLGEGTPRRLTRARLADREARARRTRADAVDSRAAGQPVPVPQRAGS